jgi:hypothetical protein
MPEFGLSALRLTPPVAKTLRRPPANRPVPDSLDRPSPVSLPNPAPGLRQPEALCFAAFSDYRQSSEFFELIFAPRGPVLVPVRVE